MAVLKLIQRRLTLVDLSLDRTIYRQYTLARQAFVALGDEFTFARLTPELAYAPFAEGLAKKERQTPAIYTRQGLPLGIWEASIESLIQGGSTAGPSVMSYAECEIAYAQDDSRTHKALDNIAFLIDDFHPTTRPVFWRMLVAAACLYRVLSNPHDLRRDDWDAAALTHLAEDDISRFDWRAPQDGGVEASAITAPLEVARAYFAERLSPRLARIQAMQAAQDEDAQAGV